MTNRLIFRLRDTRNHFSAILRSAFLRKARLGFMAS